MVIIPLLIVIVGAIVLLFMAEEPPVKEIESTREVLSEAEGLDAEVYSRKLYREAKVLYDSAMVCWKKENDKLIVFRKFKQTRTLADKAKIKGKKAIEKAKQARKNSKEDLKTEIENLRQEMKEFEKIFAALPLSQKIKNEHSKGKLLLNAAEIAFEKGEYNAGREKSLMASRLIRDSYRGARKVLMEYFAHLPQWKEQLQEAIALSKKRKEYVVVVEKIPARCDLYYNGVKKYSFKAEFGRNWIGDKRSEGDYATPEGIYKVTKRLQGRSTKYYKALLIDYPNKNDRNHFEQLKKAGKISRGTKIGGLIEIHGDGGRGANWTNGCVALENKDMDKLYRHIENGTPVIIIGASSDLDEALKNNN